MIPSLMKNLDGTNSPFIVPSSVTFEELHESISEKLQRHPNIVKLCYKLDTDKVKASTTLIQSEDKLQMFKDRMRLLLVPQHLANGSISKRMLKAVAACFEDAADDRAKAGGPDSGKGKQVCNVIGQTSFLLTTV